MFRRFLIIIFCWIYQLQCTAYTISLSYCTVRRGWIWFPACNDTTDAVSKEQHFLTNINRMADGVTTGLGKTFSVQWVGWWVSGQWEKLKIRLILVSRSWILTKLSKKHQTGFLEGPDCVKCLSQVQVLTDLLFNSVAKLSCSPSCQLQPSWLSDSLILHFTDPHPPCQ